MALVWNQFVYFGARLFTTNRPHSDWTLTIDHFIPFLPCTVAIYFGCYLFWAVNYLLIASRERKQAYRFFCADFLAKSICLFCFVLLPTTNIRPVVDGHSVWDVLMRFLYRIDAPNNLFPSIHCLVSWLCWEGARGQRELPQWYRCVSLLMAVAVCFSTLTTRQHVIVDMMGGILLAKLCYWIVGLEPVAQKFLRIMDWLLTKKP